MRDTAATTSDPTMRTCFALMVREAAIGVPAAARSDSDALSRAQRDPLQYGRLGGPLALARLGPAHVVDGLVRELHHVERVSARRGTSALEIAHQHRDELIGGRAPVGAGR